VSPPPPSCLGQKLALSRPNIGRTSAALEHLAEPAPDDFDPADLRGCLTGMTAQVIDMFTGPKARVLPRVLFEAAQYPTHFDDTVQSIVRARFGTEWFGPAVYQS
jgi:hypothetical protein